MNKDKRTLIAITSQQWEKHHEAIAAWMNGDDIEFTDPSLDKYPWQFIESPTWNTKIQYLRYSKLHVTKWLTV